MEKDILFKKATFGGFDKEDVMNYIAKITDEFQAYKNQTIVTVDKLREKIDALEKEKNELQEKYDNLCEEMNGIQEKTEESAPEAAVSITSSLTGSNAMAVSNVIGSNLFNMLMVIGIAALLSNLLMEKSVLKKDLPFLVAITLLFAIFIFS